MSFRKGQAALDFLMTYGWAIALVVIIAAVLFALGIFDVSNFLGTRFSGFSGVGVSAARLDTAGTFTMALQNQVGQRIRIDAINVTIGQNTSAMNVTSLTQLAVGAASGTISSTTGAFGTQTSGSSYTAKVTIAYTDLNSNFPYQTTGTIVSKVS